MGQVLWVMPGICGHPVRIRAATPGRLRRGSRRFAATRFIWGRGFDAAGSRRPHVVGVRQALGTVVPVLDPDRADPDELLHRPVHRVGRPLAQPPGQRRPRRHPCPRRLAVPEQHRIEPDSSVADLGVEQPLRDDREAFLDDQVSWAVDLPAHRCAPAWRTSSATESATQTVRNRPPRAAWRGTAGTRLRRSDALSGIPRERWDGCRGGS